MSIPSLQRLAFAIAALGLSACASPPRPYVDARIVATDVTYLEADPTSGEITARSRDPWGRIAAGVTVELTPRLQAFGELAHISSLATSRDRGENSAAAGLRFTFGAH
jgi:hypothetical protein